MQRDRPFLLAAFAPGAPFPPAILWGFALLAAMATVQLVLFAWLFQRLRGRHASTYEAIGSPSLVWNNSLRSNWLFLKFLYSSRRRELGDETTTRGIGFLRVLLPVYMLFFIALAISFLLASLPA